MSIEIDKEYKYFCDPKDLMDDGGLEYDILGKLIGSIVTVCSAAITADIRCKNCGNDQYHFVREVVTGIEFYTSPCTLWPIDDPDQEEERTIDKELELSV